MAVSAITNRQWPQNRCYIVGKFVENDRCCFCVADRGRDLAPVVSLRHRRWACPRIDGERRRLAPELMLQRYAVGNGGRTAYERLRRRTCRAVVIPTGEKVRYRRIRAGTERKNKAEAEWFQGIWLGPAAGSSETLIGAIDECRKKA